MELIDAIAKKVCLSQNFMQEIFVFRMKKFKYDTKNGNAINS